MTHRERFEKVTEAIKAAISGEDCAVVFIMASSGPAEDKFSVMSNLPDRGKIALMEDAIQHYQDHHMEREVPKSVQ